MQQHFLYISFATFDTYGNGACDAIVAVNYMDNPA